MTPQEKFDKFVEENKLSLKTKFVPFSVSRNAEEKNKSLNWKVTLTSPRGQFTTDYMKGIGHLPYPQEYSYNRKAINAQVIKEAIDSAVETGIAREIVENKGIYRFGLKNLAFPTPTLKEVLESLALDSEVKDYLSFEDWASNFGYDTDSRSAEKTYQACQKAAEGLAKVLGGSNKIDEIKEIIYEIENEPTTKKVKP